MPVTHFERAKTSYQKKPIDPEKGLYLFLFFCFGKPAELMIDVVRALIKPLGKGAPLGYLLLIGWI
jgi:hypothetical protein